MFRVAAASWVLAGSLLVSLPAEAQSDGPGGHRKWMGGAIGAVVAGVPALLADNFDTRLGTCTRTECFAPLAAVAGFTLGFLLGKDLDDRAALRFVAGPVRDLSPVRTVTLPFMPRRARSDERGALLVGPQGLFRLEPGVEHHLGGVRGLLDAALLREQEAILAVTGAGLFALPVLSGAAPGRQVGAAAGRRIAAGGAGVVVAGSGELMEYSVSGRGTSLELAETARTTGGAPVADLVWSGVSAVVWVLAGNRVTARGGNMLTEVGEVGLPGDGHTLDVDGPLALVAAGTDGVYILDLSDPVQPQLAARYQGVRDARDAALLGSDGYVAAGEQGLVVLDLDRPSEPRVTAVVRNLGSPSLVVRISTEVWVVDETTGEIHEVASAGTSLH